MFEQALFLCLLQVQESANPGLRRQSPPQEQAPRPFSTEQEENAQCTDYEEHEFATRFNGLMHALADFASTYNAGHVVDAKKAKAVRRAMRELEKSEWFRRGKSD